MIMYLQVITNKHDSLLIKHTTYAQDMVMLKQIMSAEYPDAKVVEINLVSA